MYRWFISTSEELKSKSTGVQFKTMRYWLIPNRTATIEKVDNSKCW